MKITKDNKAVTLIALIITIIVLLILAGVAFSSLLGSNGLLNRASDAAEKSREASDNEEIALQKMENEIAKWGNGGSGGPTVPPEWEEHVEDVTADGVPIPKGFTYVTGTKSTETVIKDGNNNEFVWVPVADLDADGTRDGTHYTERFGRRKFGMTQMIGGTATAASTFTEDIPSEIINSVDIYGGFYIARYQASFGSGSAVGNYKPLSKPSTSNSTSSMSYTAGTLWNFVSQVDAIQICSNMYESEASVVSHLPYGAEWDSTLQFLKQTTFSGNNAPLGSDSGSWGNYKDVVFRIWSRFNKSFKY